jgi:hypothetical protein
VIWELLSRLWPYKWPGFYFIWGRAYGYNDDHIGREKFPLWYRQHCLVRDGKSIQRPAGLR